jgi:class 3 adenylate cyclase
MEAGPRRGALPEGVLTMLFSDIEGSTRLLHEIGDQYGEVLDDHHRVLREVPDVAWRRRGVARVAPSR